MKKGPFFLLLFITWTVSVLGAIGVMVWGWGLTPKHALLVFGGYMALQAWHLFSGVLLLDAARQAFTDGPSSGTAPGAGDLNEAWSKH